MMHATKRVNGTILWANMHMLFWLSLVPFVTAWLGENGGAWPTALYGAVLLMAGIAYAILERTIVASEGRDSVMARAVGRDAKAQISVAVYVVAIALAFAHESGCLASSTPPSRWRGSSRIDASRRCSGSEACI